jgi:protein transport protein SEC61 subunit alpha
MEFEGSFINLIYMLITKESKMMAIWISFTRESAPNLASLIYQKSRGYLYNFPVRLFYTSTISIILQSLFLSHFYKLSELLYSRFPKFILVRLLGTW